MLVKNQPSVDYFNKIACFPFVLNYHEKFLDRNQSDLRRSKLKSCRGRGSNRPIIASCYTNYFP